MILKVVSDGLLIDLQIDLLIDVQKPIQFTLPRDAIMGDDEEMSICDKEIQSLIQKRTIFPSSGLDKGAF